MKSKKGKTYEEMVARLKAGARAERERIDETREQNKSETLQIRLEPDVMQKILAIADARGIKHSTLVRGWIAQMVDAELLSEDKTRGFVVMENSSADAVINAINSLSVRIQSLEDAFGKKRPNARSKKQK